MNIKLASADVGNVTLEIMNSFGQTLQSETLQSFVGEQNWIINVSDLPNGHYMARVKIGDKTAVQRFQKFTK